MKIKLVLIGVLILVALLGTYLMLKKNGDIHIYTVDATTVNITPESLEKAFADASFTIGVNSDVEDALYAKYKQDKYEVYNTISIFHNEHSIALTNEHADAGVLLPMGVTMYQRKGETTMHIAVLRKEAQAKLIGKNSKHLDSLETKVLKVIETLVPTAKHSYNTERLDESRKLLTRYALDLNGKDWEDAKEELEENFEDGFEAVGFVMPSYFDHMEMLGEDNPYDFYITYSICKLEIIQAVSIVKPEAAAFAPCTTMIYKKKDEDKIVMGFTSVYNWFSSAKVSDRETVDKLMEAQIAFETVVKKVTGK